NLLVAGRVRQGRTIARPGTGILPAEAWTRSSVHTRDPPRTRSALRVMGQVFQGRRAIPPDSRNAPSSTGNRASRDIIVARRPGESVPHPGPVRRGGSTLRENRGILST